MFPNIFPYLSAGLSTILLGGWLYYSTTVSSLELEVNNQSVVIAECMAAIVTKDLAIDVADNSNTVNINTIATLQTDIAGLINTASISNKIHSSEVQSLKKLLASLEADIQILGTISVPSCEIKIQEVHDEVDYIGKSISNIGF